MELLSPDGSVRSTHSLDAEPAGYFAGYIAEASVGDRYRFRLDAGSFPDPASRFQPAGPHGPSEIVDPAFIWTDDRWSGRPAEEWVMYELHLGTFTPEGTWAAARAKLPLLAELGVTVVELMPLADFAGSFGWGYDGVDLFAPCRLYGSPNDARAFVDRAHALGLMVILDVVYNHVGPDANHLARFSRDYFSTRYANEWGQPLNFDGDNSAAVREFFITNARYWIEEFHFDGLRLDATQQIFDASPVPILTEIAAAVRRAGGARQICLVAENECQQARLVRSPQAGGCGLDALWNDDFHHAAHVAATGRAEAYYSGYRGRAHEFVSVVQHGFLYQGQWYAWQNSRRGSPAFDLRPLNYVVFLQNHDQVANSLRGERLHQLAAPGLGRALTALLLLGPNVPLLFQGQEFAASAPFCYFADHHPELAAQVREGRARFLSQFATIASARAACLPVDPGSRETFERCRLDWAEHAQHAGTVRLHADLLTLRRREAGSRTGLVLAAVLEERAFVVRFRGGAAGDRLLVVNLGADVRLDPAPEPLLAPPEDRGWRIAWSSEAPEYGGHGVPPIETRDGWMLPGASATWLAPDENRELGHARLREKP